MADHALAVRATDMTRPAPMSAPGENTLAAQLNAAPRVTALHATARALNARLAPVVQRVAISQAAATEALVQRAPAFAGVSNILQPWDPDWDESNCHGYTVNEAPGHAIDGDDLLAELGGIAAIVFVRNGQIMHSGRDLGGGRLRHLLIGVGILESDVGDNAMGYEQSFTLPAQRAALDAYLLPRIERQRISELARQRANIVARGIGSGIAGAEELVNRLYDVMDEPDSADRHDAFAAYDVFVEAHPDVLIEPEEEEGEESE